jgi:hypothetical protein
MWGNCADETVLGKRARGARGVPLSEVLSDADTGAQK